MIKRRGKVFLDSDEVAAFLSEGWATVITPNHLRQIAFRGALGDSFKEKGRVYYDKEKVEHYALNRRGTRTTHFERPNRSRSARYSK